MDFLVFGPPFVSFCEKHVLSLAYARAVPPVAADGIVYRCSIPHYTGTKREQSPAAILNGRLTIAIAAQILFHHWLLKNQAVAFHCPASEKSGTDGP